MENDFEAIQKEHEAEQQKELENALAKINAGERTTENYFEVYSSYYYKQKKNEYKREIDEYAKFVLHSAQEDISMNRNPAQAYSYMAYVYSYSKIFDKALYCVNKSIELEPQTADFYVIRADIYKHQRKNKLAEADYQKATELNPEWGETIAMLKNTDKLIKDASRTVFTIYAIFAIAIISILYFLISPFIRF